MTLTYELDTDIWKSYLHTKNELSRSRLSKVRELQTDRQTDTQTDATENVTTPHSAEIIIIRKETSVWPC